MIEKFLFNKKDTAKIMGVSVQSLSKWDIAPKRKTGREVFYYLPEVVDWRLARDTAESLNLTAERARLAKEQADGHALKNAQTQGELVSLDILTYALSNVASQVVSILDALPLQIKKRCPQLNARAIEIIRREIVKAMNAMSEVRLDTSQGSKNEISK